MASTTYYTGIDLHKKSAYLTTLDKEGAVACQKKLPCRREALHLYFRRLEGRHLAVIETTTGWHWVSDLLEEEGVALVLAHAKHLKAIAYAKVKTDKVDSATLAHLLRTDMIPEAHETSNELRPMRDVLRTRLCLVDRRIAAINSVHRLLEKMNVRSVAALPELMQLQARCHLDEVELLERQIKRLEKTLRPELLPRSPVQRLLRIPGIGEVNAYTIRLEIGDIGRFPSEKQFFSYARLVPGASDSGARTRHKKSKDGNRYLKLAFSHAVVRAVQRRDRLVGVWGDAPALDIPTALCFYSLTTCNTRNSSPSGTAITSQARIEPERTGYARPAPTNGPHRTSKRSAIVSSVRLMWLRSRLKLRIILTVAISRRGIGNHRSGSKPH